MNDNYLPLVYFAVLEAVVIAAAISGTKMGRNGLIGCFTITWLLLDLWWLSIATPITLGMFIAIVAIFAFALWMVYFPMARVFRSKSFVKLFIWGTAGATVSSIATLYIVVTVACSLFGDCL
jgi:hypothetical protein